MYTQKIKRLIALMLVFCLMLPTALADTAVLRAAPLSTGGELNGLPQFSEQPQSIGYHRGRQLYH